MWDTAGHSPRAGQVRQKGRDWQGRFENQRQSWVQILASVVPSYVTLGKSFKLLSLSFLLWKMDNSRNDS